MGNTRRRFTAEFKRDAVRLRSHPGAVITQIAKKPGVDQSALRRCDDHRLPMTSALHERERPAAEVVRPSNSEPAKRLSASYLHVKTAPVAHRKMKGNPLQELPRDSSR